MTAVLDAPKTVGFVLPSSLKIADGMSSWTVVPTPAPNPPPRRRGRLAPAVPYPRHVEVSPKLLRDAALLLRQMGLYKHDLWPGALCETWEAPHQFYNFGDPLCAWGAILVVAGWGQAPLRQSIHEMIGDPLFVLHNLVNINDRPDATTATVSKRLLLVADRLEEITGRYNGSVARVSV